MLTHTHTHTAASAAGPPAGLVTPEELAAECVLPGAGRLREVAGAVAAAVAAAAVASGQAGVTVDSARCLPALRSAAAARGGGGPGAAGAAAALECVQRLQEPAAA
jgi:malic enzyme